MRFALTALVLVMAASTADAQFRYQSCPNGQCQAAPGVGYSLPGGTYADPGPAPSANHELHLVGGRLVWVAKAGAVPQAMAKADGVPPDIVGMYRAKNPATKAMHGQATYRLVKRIAERQLVDEAVKKGYRLSDARAKAKQLVDDLDEPTIDAVSRYAGVKEGIGDGIVGDRIDNILRIIDAIMKLLLLFL